MRGGLEGQAKTGKEGEREARKVESKERKEGGKEGEREYSEKERKGERESLAKKAS